MTKAKSEKLPNKRVRNSAGVSNCFDTEIVRDVVKRTGLDRASVDYIIETYKDILLENIAKGRRVELKRFGYFVFWLKKGWFSRKCFRTIEDRYYIKFIFTGSLRRLVTDNVTIDLIDPTKK